MKNTFKIFVAIAASALISACGGGGGGDDTRPVAAADVTVPASPAAVAAVKNVSFDFKAGVPSFGTTSTTTLAFGGTASTPTFAIQADGGTATGALAFGSCIFTMVTSDFPDEHPLAKGKTVTVQPCEIRLDTEGEPADATPTSVPFTLVLGTVVSEEEDLVVTISANGAIAVGGEPVGTVTVVEVSGGGS